MPFYPPDQVIKSQALYSRMKKWALGRPDVTVIGGWAVWEHVTPAVAEASRDIDIVFHSEDALLSFRIQMDNWDLVWRKSGRRVFKDCHFKDDPNREIQVDVFTTDLRIGEAFFGLEKATNVKEDAAGQPFVPGLEYILADKILTVPRRHEPDVRWKRLKDLLDIHHLVFHNRASRLPAELRTVASLESRKAAAGFIEQALSVEKRDGAVYRPPMDDVRRWLMTP